MQGEHSARRFRVYTLARMCARGDTQMLSTERRIAMDDKKKKHDDTSISLRPLSFEEAIRTLANTPKQTDSEKEASGSTTTDAPPPDRKAGRTAPRRQSDAG